MVSSRMTSRPSAQAEAKLPPGHPFFDLIDEAYRVFAYPRPSSTEVCACCMDAKILADFFNPPIRDLPLGYVREWYFGAYEPSGVAKGTWGYLLPRLLEILAAGEDVSPMGIEVSLNRFETGNPAHWSKAEWGILDRFQRLFLQAYVEQGKDCLDDAICMFRLAGWPLADLLDQVASIPDDKLALRLWSDWCRHGPSGYPNIWITAFWENSDNSAVFEFYTSRAMYERMEALALADDVDPALAVMAAAVAELIEVSAVSLRHT
jgi:hypothetical protein